MFDFVICKFKKVWLYMHMTLNVLTETRCYLTPPPIILCLKAALLQVCIHYANSHTFCCSKQRGELFLYHRILTSYFGSLFQSSKQLMQLLATKLLQSHQVTALVHNVHVFCSVLCGASGGVHCVTVHSIIFCYSLLYRNYKVSYKGRNFCKAVFFSN